MKVPNTPDVQLPPGTTWRDFAECSGLDHNMFFPQRGQSTREAKAICDSCYVQEQCLEDAIELREPAGIRGMKSTRERQAIIKQRIADGVDVTPRSKRVQRPSMT